MVKKTKDSELKTKVTKKANTKSSTTKSAQKTTAKSATAKTVKKANAKSATTTAKKATSNKSTVKNSATATKKTSVKKVTAKKTTGKKSTVKKIATKNSTKVPKKASVKGEKPAFQSEYYDLPYGYNKTVVKVLAQTPTTLFVYWEISEDDRNRFKETYGENFFETTKPVLILYNDTLNYSSEIEINDFANSWYIHINDSNCEYRVELGRKPIPMANMAKAVDTTISRVSDQSKSVYIPYYVYITSSNEMSAPNDRILFGNTRKIKFKNIKTGAIRERDIKEFKFITNYGIMNIEELYKSLYPNENFSYDEFLRNPSSGMTSSRSFSSQFK